MSPKNEALGALPLGTKLRTNLFGVNGYCRLEPDNVYGVIDLASVELLPEDADKFELLSPPVFRAPERGEPYLSFTRWVSNGGDVGGEDTRRLICRSKPREEKTQKVLVIELTDADSADWKYWKYVFSNSKGVVVRIEERPITEEKSAGWLYNTEAEGKQ